MEWKSDGSLCPVCGGAGRNSPRYPGALCRPCEASLVDEMGRTVELSNEDIWSGVRIRADDAVLPKDASLFASGVECRVREARFGGVVVQPLEVWERSRG
jgi:ADP-ribosyl-[dinitrogen reductase] hydrolase